jgi:hypothetical protein
MKLPFDYVAKHVDALFSESEELTNDAEIDKSCELVSTFIKACGWDEIEFWRIMYGHDSPADQKELSKLN